MLRRAAKRGSLETACHASLEERLLNILAGEGRA